MIVRRWKSNRSIAYWLVMECHPSLSWRSWGRRDFTCEMRGEGVGKPTRKVLADSLCEAAKRFMSATENWMDNRPDDEQFTWKEMASFAKNEAKEFEAAKAILELAILKYEK